MLTEEAVFLRSFVFGEGKGGDIIGSFAVLRESHENGLVNFLVTGVGAGNVVEVGACGGGAHGTEGRTPDNPCTAGFFGSGAAGIMESGTVLGVSFTVKINDNMHATYLSLPPHV